MALLRITEFGGNANWMAGGMSAPIWDTTGVVHQSLTIGAEVKSAAFATATRMVRLHAEAPCCVSIGLNPTATTAMLRLALGQTEYFGVAPTHKVSVITST